MKEKLRRLIVQLTYLVRTLRLIWHAARGWTAAWGILLVIQGLLPAATVSLTRLLVDSLSAALGAETPWAHVDAVLVPAAIMGGLLLMANVLQSAGHWVRTAQAELVRDHMAALLHQKAVAIDLACYEIPAFHNQLHRARSEASSRSLALLESSGGLIQNGISLVAITVVILPYGPWLPIVLLLSTLPALYVVLAHNGRYHDWWQRTTEDRRWIDYYDMLLSNSAVAAEVRLFDLGAHFQSAYQKRRHRLRNEQLQLTRAQMFANVGVNACALGVAAGAMAWMGWQALHGLFTLGDLALFYQAFNKGQGLLRVLVGNLAQLYANSLFLENLFTYLALEPQIIDSPAPVPLPEELEQGIVFHNVTFCYPGSTRAVLEDFSFEIPAGQIIAIVGANGAGKSTLVKLLCRFYDPDAGSIQIDGIDIRSFSLQELRRRISVLFQVPVPYHDTAAQNIALGDLKTEPSMDELHAAAQHAGVHALIEQLPRGYNTVLGKWFADGTELSGGEWQRIALARAFFRRAQIIILDEPTSAMDSWAENDWLDRFRRLAQGRTAVVITHRFTTAMRADVIYVMDRGRIVETGTHAELLGQGGLYAQSWTAQLQAGSTEGVKEPMDPAVWTSVAQAPIRNGAV